MGAVTTTLKGLEKVKSARLARQKKDLNYLHNASPEALLRYQQIGGLPVPSLGITKADIPFDNYGGITLLGKPDRFHPENDPKAQVFDADAYTARAPRPFRLSKPNAVDVFDKGIGKKLDDYGYYAGDIRNNLRQISDIEAPDLTAYQNIENKLQRDPSFDVLFLESVGQKVPKTGSGKPDKTEAAILASKMPEEKQKFTQAVMDELLEPKSYFIADRDFDYYSDDAAKVQEYTAENLAKFMAEDAGRGSEGGSAVSSTGGQRAYTTKELLHSDLIRDEKARLATPEQMAEFKTTTDNLGYDLQEAFKKYYDFDSSSYGYGDDFTALIQKSEIIPMGDALRESGFTNAPESLTKELEEYKDLLRSGQTEYFEVKPKRVVGFDDFAGAIVPENTSADVLSVLKQNKIPYKTYTEESERMAARKAFPDAAFALGGATAVGGALSPAEQAMASVGQSPFLGGFQADNATADVLSTVGSGMAAYPLAAGNAALGAVQGETPEQISGRANTIYDALTYMPKTQEGQAALLGMGDKMGALDQRYGIGNKYNLVMDSLANQFPVPSWRPQVRALLGEL